MFKQASEINPGDTVRINGGPAMKVDDFRSTSSAYPVTVALKVAGEWRVMPAEMVAEIV